MVLLIQSLVVMLAFTPVEQAALDAAQDRSPRLDEAALYPLLRDAVQGPAPDWQALRDDPAAHRGELFLVRGRFLASEPMKLARTGPWGEVAQRWVVQHGPGDDDVAVLVLAVPPGTSPQTPGLHEPVAAPARFYKLWTVTDSRNELWDFPVFVGRLADPPAAADGPGGLWGPVTLAVLVLLAAFIALQLMLRRLPRTAPRRAPAAPPLYDAQPRTEAGDPADALDALARRREEEGR
jgi:hypothetical protein